MDDDESRNVAEDVLRDDEAHYGVGVVVGGGDGVVGGGGDSYCLVLLKRGQSNVCSIFQ